jgi:hypothetical protein
MPPAVFEPTIPACERPQTHPLYGAVWRELRSFAVGINDYEILHRVWLERFVLNDPVTGRKMCRKFWTGELNGRNQLKSLGIGGKITLK